MDIKSFSIAVAACLVAVVLFEVGKMAVAKQKEKKAAKSGAPAIPSAPATK